MTADALMVRPVHPDRLDAVSASRDSSKRRQATGVVPATKDEVTDCLKFLARQGSSNLPRKSRTRSIILALTASLMIRYRAYSEAELNDLLQSWLSESGLSVDHVACRRYMIEHGFVRRDRAGRRYIADYSRIEMQLGDDALKWATEFMSEHEKGAEPTRDLIV